MKLLKNYRQQNDPQFLLYLRDLPYSRITPRVRKFIKDHLVTGKELEDAKRTHVWLSGRRRKKSTIII